MTLNEVSKKGRGRKRILVRFVISILKYGAFWRKFYTPQNAILDSEAVEGIKKVKKIIKVQFLELFISCG